jgi:hypothetical protein
MMAMANPTQMRTARGMLILFASRGARALLKLRSAFGGVS